MSNNQKKKNRTKKLAEKAGALTELPNRLALITLAISIFICIITL